MNKVMNNLEFCNMVKAAKAMSHKTNVDIIIAIKKSQGAISDMLNGRTDSTLTIFLPYIRAIDSQLVLRSATDTRYIQTPSDVTKWLNDMIAKCPQSFAELGHKLEVTAPTAWRIMKGGAVRLSVFLKLADLFQYYVSIEPLPEQP